MRTARSLVHAYCLAYCLSICSADADAQNGIPVPPINMMLELALDSPTCVLHGNFSFTVRILNPNAFPVTFRGFEMDSYIEPEIHLLRKDNSSLHLRYRALDSALTNTPITILAGQTLEKRRFLWMDNLASLAWPDIPGRYQLCASSAMLHARVGAGEVWHPVEWSFPISELRVQAPGPADRRAWEWLAPRLEQYEQALRHPNPGDESVSVRKVRIYHEFLVRFPDSSYAPAIRWETAKLLLSELGNKRVPDDEVPQLVQLLDDCLTFCLGRGGAYAEEFLEVQKGSWRNQALDFAIEHRRMELADLITDRLDERHPENESAKLYRRGFVAGYKESGEAARQILEIIVEKFPDDEYAEYARKQIEHIERGWWPPKPIDEESALYNAAGKRVYESPEEGRRMLQELLERYPNGRYTKQIRDLISAIDEGTWPPHPIRKSEP